MASGEQWTWVGLLTSKGPNIFVCPQRETGSEIQDCLHALQVISGCGYDYVSFVAGKKEAEFLEHSNNDDENAAARPGYQRRVKKSDSPTARRR